MKHTARRLRTLSLIPIAVLLGSCAVFRKDEEKPAEPNYSFEKSNQHSRFERMKRWEEKRYQDWKRRLIRGND